MAISELAERIEARLAGLEQEISRLQAAEQVLAATRPQAVAAEPAPQPRSAEPAQQPAAGDPASRHRAPDNAAARRASKPTTWWRSAANWTRACATAPDPRPDATL